jgi:hypothetical protein
VIRGSWLVDSDSQRTERYLDADFIPKRAPALRLVSSCVVRISYFEEETRRRNEEKKHEEGTDF